MAEPSKGARGSGERIVSLVPSVTETLLAWGIEPVAVTRFCEQPGIRAVGGTKDPDLTAIVELRPDLVVVNDEENRREDAEALTAAGLRLHVTRVMSVRDVDPCLEELAEAVGGRRSPAERDAFERIAAMGEGDRSVFVPIWRRPWMTMNADTYGSSVLCHLGLANVFADAAQRYPTVDFDQVRGRRPALVLLPSEPYPFKPRHIDELAPLGAEVRLVDGQDLFWWGIRTPAALARLRHEVARAR